MGNSKVISLFIIYAWQHHEQYVRLIYALDSLPDFCWINNSVPRDNAGCGNRFSSTDDLKNYLTDRIKKSDYVLIILSNDIAREWINFEVQAARSLGKPIIGIRPDASGSDYFSIVKPDIVISQDATSIKTLTTMAINES